MTVATITDELRTRYELTEGVKGVVIVEVTDGGPAGAESLRPGDVIVEVGQEEVTSPPEVAAKVNQAQQDDKKSVLLLIDRQGDLRFVALRFPEPAAARPRRPGARSAWRPPKAACRGACAPRGVAAANSRGSTERASGRRRTARAALASDAPQARFSSTTKSLLATPCR